MFVFRGRQFARARCIRYGCVLCITITTITTTTTTTTVTATVACTLLYGYIKRYSYRNSFAKTRRLRTNSSGPVPSNSTVCRWTFPTHVAPVPTNSSAGSATVRTCLSAFRCCFLRTRIDNDIIRYRHCALNHYRDEWPVNE